MTAGTKGVIQRIVGNLHVSASDDAVLGDIRARINVSPKTQAAIEKYAVKVHRENQALYRAVMGGNIR